MYIHARVSARAHIQFFNSFLIFIYDILFVYIYQYKEIDHIEGDKEKGEGKMREEEPWTGSFRSGKCGDAFLSRGKAIFSALVLYRLFTPPAHL